MESRLFFPDKILSFLVFYSSFFIRMPIINWMMFSQIDAIGFTMNPRIFGAVRMTIWDKLKPIPMLSP
jgi:hypothetical protein